MLKSASPLTHQMQSFDDEKTWCSISLESEKDSAADVSVVDIDLNESLPLPTPISTSADLSKAAHSYSTPPHHRARQEGSDSTVPFTFRCRPRSFPASLITPPMPADPLLSCATSTPSSSKPTFSENITAIESTTISLNGAGPSITEIQDSLVACSIETRESYATLSKRRFGFDTSLSNIQYGYGSSRPYRFTSPLSPDPKIRKRSKHRRHKPKSAPASLLQKTLRRTHADALRKRYPPRPISVPPPSYDFLPSLDEDDEDDEFDDDEDDEIIDDFDADGDAQVDDIVDLYNQRSSEQDVCGNNSRYSYMRGTPGPEPVTIATKTVPVTTLAESLIHISSNMMTDPSGDLEPVTLKPVLEETGAFVYVAHESDF